MFYLDALLFNFVKPIFSLSRRPSSDKRNKKKNKKNKKKDFCNACCRTSNTTETENRGDDGYN